MITMRVFGTFRLPITLYLTCCSLEQVVFANFFFDVPQGVAAVTCQAIESADAGQDTKFIFVQPGAAFEIVERGERRFLSFGEEAFGAGVAQTADDSEAEAHAIVGLDGAIPIGARDADGAKFEAVTLAVFD
jgi:hypothetical protein